MIRLLEGYDDKIRVVLNKADALEPSDLLKVNSALTWALARILRAPEVRRIYVGSFWDQPLRAGNFMNALFEKEAVVLLHDLATAPRNNATAKLNDLITRARRVRVQALLFHELRSAMPKMTMIARLSRDGPALDLCSDGLNAPELQGQARDAAKIFRQLASSSEQYGTIESSPYNFHYCLDDNVCFMTIAEQSFSKNVAFAYLDELKKEFMSLYGGDVGKETRPFAYMKFERFMQRTKTAFTDPETKRNLDKLGTELKDVRTIMSANIQDVLQRGEKLNKAAEESHRLVEDSKLYRKSASSLNRWLWLRQFAPVGFVGIVVLGFLYFFYFR